MASVQTYELVRGSGTTTGNTPLTIITWPIPTGRSITAEVFATGKDTTNGDTVSRKVMGAAKNVGGVVAMVGSLANPLAVGDAALTTSSVNATNSGGNLIVTVTGSIGKTLDWEVSCQIQVC